MSFILKTREGITPNYTTKFLGSEYKVIFIHTKEGKEKYSFPNDDTIFAVIESWDDSKRQIPYALSNKCSNTIWTSNGKEFEVLTDPRLEE